VPFLQHEGVPVEVRYAEVTIWATRAGPWGPAQPKRIGRVDIDADGWLRCPGNQATQLARVERLRIATRPGGPLEEVTQDKGQEFEDPYVVHLGSRAIRVLAQDDDPWFDPPQRILAFLNELLTAHGSPERAYGYSAGNEFSIVFATPEMARVINATSPRWAQMHDGSNREPWP
jgi:hypothetical protein